MSASLFPQAGLSRVEQYFQSLQAQICHTLEEIDQLKAFQVDPWERLEGGAGNSRILEEGRIFTKAGVNFSHIHGKTLPPTATLRHPELAGQAFHALGISVVIHPFNPYVPTSHFNLRFFIASQEEKEPLWWFGGGFDLTPYYGFKEDCIHWHKTAKAACDPFGEDIYTRFKQNCDTYFYLPHRQEARGIGGLFFDDWKEKGFAESFALVQAIGNHFMKGYTPIVNRRKDHPFSALEKQFQHYRRGRYVEFNLLYDRGTSFGLQSQGRTESILMSLPPEVSWRYNWQPAPGSKEEALYTDFLPIQDWL